MMRAETSDPDDAYGADDSEDGPNQNRSPSLMSSSEGATAHAVLPGIQDVERRAVVPNRTDRARRRVRAGVDSVLGREPPLWWLLSKRAIASLADGAVLWLRWASMRRSECRRAQCGGRRCCS